MEVGQGPNLGCSAIGKKSYPDSLQQRKELTQRSLRVNLYVTYEGIVTCELFTTYRVIHSEEASNY
jgi:hypothetical protein